VASWRRLTFPVPPVRGLELAGEGLALEAVKPAEDGDGIVVRVVNFGRDPTDGVWRSGGPITGAERLRADESAGESLAVGHEGRSVRFHAAPGEIVSIRLRVKPGPLQR
jgi:alpha-mannosidase